MRKFLLGIINVCTNLLAVEANRNTGVAALKLEAIGAERAVTDATVKYHMDSIGKVERLHDERKAALALAAFDAEREAIKCGDIVNALRNITN